MGDKKAEPSGKSFPDTPEGDYKKGLYYFGRKEFNQAFNTWLKSANKGYAKAMCDVGWMYSQGNGVEKNEKKAFEYMLKAATNGYVRAQNNIGLYYKNGTGTPVDIIKAIHWLEQAEKANYEQLAGNTLKNCRRMLVNKGKDKDDKKTPGDSKTQEKEGQRRTSGNKGATAEVTPEQTHAFGMAAFTAKDYTKAFNFWKIASSRGNAEAMCDVGWMYSQGYGITKENKQAFRYMLRSAELGYLRAQNNIGLYYKNGTGTPQNFRKAVEWLEKAEAAKYPKLARKTLQEAKELLAKETQANAQQQDYALGLEMFGKQKFKQAFQHWVSAANNGFAKAMCDVGWMYSQGHGVDKDNKKAFDWMLMSAEKGYTRAQNNIGLYYKNGTGTPIKMAKAVEWLEKAESASYDKLARKALKEARRILKGDKIASGESRPSTAGVAMSEGPGSNMEKYKSALRMGLATKNITEEERKVLADLRREHDITEALHEACLKELGYTLSEFEDCCKSSATPSGGNECVVCLDAIADHCILFCMHVCLCADCAASYQDENGKGKGTCPKCRTPVQMVKKIF